MSYTWILFDADGTLFDYDRAEGTALARSFAQFGCPFEAAHLQIYRRINGRIWRDLEVGLIDQARLKVRRFELLFQAAGISSPPDPAAFSAAYLEYLGACADLVGGAEEIVRSLHGRLRLALITNGLKEVQRSRLARSFIGSCFEVVVISDEVGVSKPDRAIFDVAFERMGHPPKAQVLIVGDSLTSDIRGGADYGIDTCWFNPAMSACDVDVAIRYEIHQLGELHDILGVPEPGPPD